MDIQECFSLDINVLQQPTDSTCGSTSLHAVYRYFEDEISLDQVIREVHTFEDGGTLAVWLGCHALSRGYEAILYTCNLQLLDPTWFLDSRTDLVAKLVEQEKHKTDPKLIRAGHAFVDFIQKGGQVKFADVTRELLRKYLRKGFPILTGLSSTFLYREAREISATCVHDDVRGTPAGHFVVLYGYDRAKKLVSVADPFSKNPFSSKRKYEVHIDRVLCSILLGVLTYDANFLVIRPREKVGRS